MTNCYEEWAEHVECMQQKLKEDLVPITYMLLTQAYAGLQRVQRSACLCRSQIVQTSLRTQPASYKMCTADLYRG